MLRTSAAEFCARILEKRKNQKNITVIIFSQAYIFLLALYITFFTFGLSEFGENMLPRFLVSLLIIIIVCELLYFLTYFLYAPLFIVYPLVTVAAVGNLAKINFRNEPIVFTDLLIFRESLDIAAQYPIGLERHLPALIPVFILFLAAPLFVRRLRLGIIKRAASGAAALAVAGLFFAHSLLAGSSLVALTAHSGVWNLANESRQNGFILGFTLSARRSLVFSPPNYSRDTVREYALALGFPEHHVMGEPPEVLPNVIVIMNEAFWDTANLTGIAFNYDPLGAVRGIMEQNGNARLLVPHFGGGTANMEFEFLTGKNIVYYPPGSMIYQLFINRKHWSLAWYFRGFGYSTVAVHSYHDWFWRRSSVYPLLGFENIYFQDDMMHTDRTGRYISDLSVSRELISRYGQLSENGGRPVFAFAVTMQNHGPYTGQYGNTQVRVLNRLDDHPRRMLETFAEGVRFASEAFIYLTEYFRGVERPTYIIMFGDHAPGVIPDIEEFYAIGEYPGLTEEQLFNRFVTPIIVWSNRGEPAAARNIGTVSSQMLAVELFNITGMPKPAYIKMLDNIMGTTRGFTSRYILDAGGAPHAANGFGKIRHIYDMLRVVQYDATLGRNYFIDELAGD